ncbi:MULTISPECIES: TetR/AcrR family transcriptional regulator [Rhizobium]|uniref:TetR/AcrR family transcriptional regulator n=1 Tax=Rhizobium TaxID=379 RepID=UPI001574D717|nr:TetR/AcrR family transcriptional regulator [Rhizobium rhizogenes]NTF98275.1 TetR/AcrR family transcriptional regulator [Rhizobium rhizogenes]
MVQNDIPIKRPRGRPQVRCDEDTRSVIIDVACRAFRADGYEATSINAIAQEAGVSTKTFYRLFPAKTDLFSAVVTTRIDDFLLKLDVDVLEKLGLEEALIRILFAYGSLTLSERTVRLMRLVVSESDRFPDLAAAFYEKAIVRTNDFMEAWLRGRVEDGGLALEDIHAACGMLRGMMIMEPQRASLLNQAPLLQPKEIEDRARLCASIFLRGAATPHQCSHSSLTAAFLGTEVGGIPT